MMIKNPDFKGNDKMLPVRCGKCEGCLKSKINDWAFRLEQEAKRSFSVYFVTLTYSPKYVPLTPTLLQSLSKKDCQNFLKRLRKLEPKESYIKKNGTAGQRCRVKYFLCGEYGSTTFRPHYHVIFFNVADSENIHKAWSLKDDPLGNVHIGNSIDNGAVPYTLKYMYKKGLVPAFEDDDRLPEFRIMSNRLGDNYLTPQMIKWHLADLKNRLYGQFKNGIKIALPRFYREKLIKLSGKPAFLFRNDESVFMTEDDDDFRTLPSRIVNVKRKQAAFERSRQQQNRKKL